MSFSFDQDDYTSILTEVHALSRRLEPIIRTTLPALLGRRTPSGLARVADAAATRRLHHRGYARDMLPVIVDAASLVIDEGTGVKGEWCETGYTDGGIDWTWHETTVYSRTARSLIPIRAMVAEVIDLLERIDDLVVAQRDIGDLLI